MRRTGIAALLLLALALAGCGEDRNDEGTATQAETTGTEAEQPAGKPVQTIRVSETEFRLDPENPKVKRTGVVEFVVSNDGQADHALEVEGPNGEVETDTIAPGNQATLRADLSEAGEFKWYCPVGNHEQQGMVGKITVAGGSGGGTGTETGNDSGSGNNPYE